MVYVFGTGGVKWAGANGMEWAQRRTVSAVTREAVWLNRSFASATARRMKSAEKCGNGHRRCLFENQLRIELRFTNQKNNELIHQYQGLDNLICYIPEIGHKYIGQCLNAMYGKGDFCRFDIAAQMIEASSFHPTTKQEMGKFMKVVAKGSLNDAINKHPLNYIICQNVNHCN